MSKPDTVAVPKRSMRMFVSSWIDGGAELPTLDQSTRDRIDWVRVWPYFALHAVCLFVFVVGVSCIAVGVAATLYAVRMFALTAFYHRYFSHRAFKTSRVAQFVFALIGASAVQRGPIWWAAHHRHHHAHSDHDPDVHSPVRRGFFWSHMGWFLSRRHFAPDLAKVRDLQRFPELRLIDRFDILVPISLGAILYGLGAFLERRDPELGTTGWQLVIWGSFISTLVCHHVAFLVNSLCHGVGARRYETTDDSRNNAWVALLTFGEGWHNNHHHYPSSARQGFYWWEVDVTYYGLWLLSRLGIIWDLKQVPSRVRVARLSRASGPSATGRPAPGRARR
jgi:stearoyl-CoA desaturase (Delta-9 desaturase)